MIDVLFFGRMADIVGSRRIQADDTGNKTLWAVRDHIFAGAFASGQVRTTDIHMSLNRRVVSDDLALSDGDEIAFFSIFSGG